MIEWRRGLRILCVGKFVFSTFSDLDESDPLRFGNEELRFRSLEFD